MALPKIKNIDRITAPNFSIDKLTTIVSINSNILDTNSNILKSLNNIEKTFTSYLKWKKLQADLSDDPKSNKKQISGSKPTDNIDYVTGGLGNFQLLALVGVAEYFDDYLKTLKLPKIFKDIKGAFKGIGTWATKFKSIELPKIRLPELPKFNFMDKAGELVEKFKIRLPELPKFNFMDKAGELVKKFKIRLPELPKFNFMDKAGELVEKFKIRLPELPKFNFVDKAGELVEKFKIKLPELPKFNFVDKTGQVVENLLEKFKIKLPELPKFNFVDKTGQVVENLLEKFKIKLPDMQPIRSGITGAMMQFDLFSTNLQETVKSFPKIQIEFPEWMKNFKMPDFSGIKTFFVGTEKGGGIVGKIATFFSGFKIPEGFRKLIINPLKFIIGPVLTFIDFVVGFFEGWNEVSDKDLNATFGEKLWGGTVGGLEGIIKGILGAIDVLAGKALPWLLKKMGLDDSAKFLEGMFDEEKGGGLAKHVDLTSWGESLGGALFNVFNVMIPDLIKSMTDMVSNGKKWLIDKLGLGDIFGEDAAGIDFSKIFDKFKFDISLPELEFPDIQNAIDNYGKSFAEKIGSLIESLFYKIAGVMDTIGEHLPDGWGDIFKDAKVSITKSATDMRALGKKFKKDITGLAGTSATARGSTASSLSVTPKAVSAAQLNASGSAGGNQTDPSGQRAPSFTADDHSIVNVTNNYNMGAMGIPETMDG